MIVGRRSRIDDARIDQRTVGRNPHYLVGIGVLHRESVAIEHVEGSPGHTGPQLAASSLDRIVELVVAGGDDDLVDRLGRRRTGDHPVEHGAVAQRFERLAGEPGRPHPALGDDRNAHGRGPTRSRNAAITASRFSSVSSGEDRQAQDPRVGLVTRRQVPLACVQRVVVDRHVVDLGGDAAVTEAVIDPAAVGDPDRIEVIPVFEADRRPRRSSDRDRRVRGRSGRRSRRRAMKASSLRIWLAPSAACTSVRR